MIIRHSDINSPALHQKIRRSEILLAGNRQLKIYGTLNCKSGKRMKTKNRVFFSNEKEAIEKGCRPCGHCMKNAFTEWKKKNN